MLSMAKRKYGDKLHLDMPFTEAVTRFAGVNPSEMEANIARSKQKKPPGGKKRKPSGGRVVKSQNVISLRDRRNKNHG